MTDPWRCVYGCGFTAVVQSMIRDHEQTCPFAPEETR